MYLPEVVSVSDFEIGSLDFRYLYELMKLCSPEKRENAMYTVETTGNGLTAEIFYGGVSVAFMQGEEAGQLVDEWEQCKTDEQVQDLLGQYDPEY